MTTFITDEYGDVVPDTSAGGATWDGQAPSWGSSGGGSFWSGGGSPTNTSQGMTPPAGGGTQASAFDWFRTALSAGVAYTQASNPWNRPYGSPYGSPYGQPYQGGAIPPGYRVDPMSGRLVPSSGLNLLGPLSGISTNTWLIIGAATVAVMMLSGRRGSGRGE